MKREFVRAEDGQILMVVRPKDPERALASAAKALEMQDAPAFQAIPQDPGGAYTVLEEPGALVFTPPDRLGQCTKIHVCVECFKRVILSATPKRSDDGALPKSLLEDLKRCAAEARRQAGTEGGTTCVCETGHWAFACPVHHDPFSRLG